MALFFLQSSLNINRFVTDNDIEPANIKHKLCKLQMSSDIPRRLASLRLDQL